MAQSRWDRRWSETEWHPSLGSTNTELRADPRPGRVLVADHQSQGMGRLGRSWTAPPGTALAISVAVPLPTAPAAAAWVPLVAGLAVARALESSRYAVTARLKWPNDVLVVGQPGSHGRAGKISGVLAQATRDDRYGTVVVLGAGLNVDQTRDELPVETATSWRLARGGAVLPDGAREAFVQDYLDALAGLLGRLLDEPDGAGAAADRAAYRRACGTIGSRVRVLQASSDPVVGHAVAVADTGTLRVRTDDGVEHAFHSGDVVHVRPGD